MDILDDEKHTNAHEKVNILNGKVIYFIPINRHITEIILMSLVQNKLLFIVLLYEHFNYQRNYCKSSDKRL